MQMGQNTCRFHTGVNILMCKPFSFYIATNVIFKSKKLINSLPNDKFSDSSKLKEFADDNFKFDENGRKFCKRVENTVGKGEIARHEQFLLFPQCFQKTCIADT